MGDLLKVVVCSLGCVYLLMHVVYALTSAADSVKRRDRQAEETIPSDRDARVEYRDTVGFERKTPS